jgi:SAM-dependent methyltransferase
MQEESAILARLLVRHFGKHALLIGVPAQSDLLTATSIPCHSLLTPFLQQEKKINDIEGDLHELPILTGSIDLVLIPHTLEFVDNPRQLLAEACRIIKPEGLIVIYGFNPYSPWGVRKYLTAHKNIPWSGNFIHARYIKSWLHLADFAMEKQKSVLFRPPFSNPNLYRRLHFLEGVGCRCAPWLGGVYVLLARAKVIPLTPIRMKWKQPLNGIRISTTISGNIARQIK